MTETINLKNIMVWKKTDKIGKDYYLIIDKDNPERKNNGYFCFPKSIREGFDYLEKNWENIKEIEIEFKVNEAGNKQVISIIDPNDFSAFM